MAKQPAEPKVNEEQKPPITAVSSAAQDDEVVVVAQQQDDDGSDDAAAELQKQIDALKRSEELLKSRAERAEAERAEAIRRAQERDTEVAELQKKTSKSEFDSVSSALAAAQAIAEKATKDIEDAIAAQDAKALAAATRQLSRAEADIARLETGKVALEEAAEAAKAAPAKQPVNDPLEGTNLPQQAKDWLRAHPEYLHDPRKNAKIQSLHWDVLDEGHRPFSTAYFESMETHLGMRQAPDPDDDDETPEPPKGKKVMVSAPVSRKVPAGGQRRDGKVTLTPEQLEYAAIAGIPPEEYAKQLLRLQEEKANGHYTGRP